MIYSFEEAENLLKESIIIPGKVHVPVKFLVDAQLPKRLSDFLNRSGFMSLHTLDLPDKNATTDRTIKHKAFVEGLVLITKDDDFLRSFMIEGKPSRMILVKTGNISNNVLLELFQKGLGVLTALIELHSMIEITREEIIVHD